MTGRSRWGTVGLTVRNELIAGAGEETLVARRVGGGERGAGGVAGHCGQCRDQCPTAGANRCATAGMAAGHGVCDQLGGVCGAAGARRPLPPHRRRPWARIWPWAGRWRTHRRRPEGAGVQQQHYRRRSRRSHFDPSTSVSAAATAAPTASRIGAGRGRARPRRPPWRRPRRSRHHCNGRQQPDRRPQHRRRERLY